LPELVSVSLSIGLASTGIQNDHATSRPGKSSKRMNRTYFWWIYHCICNGESIQKKWRGGIRIWGKHTFLKMISYAHNCSPLKRSIELYFNLGLLTEKIMERQNGENPWSDQCQVDSGQSYFVFPAVLLSHISHLHHHQVPAKVMPHATLGDRPHRPTKNLWDTGSRNNAFTYWHWAFL